MPKPTNPIQLNSTRSILDWVKFPLNRSPWIGEKIDPTHAHPYHIPNTVHLFEKAGLNLNPQFQEPAFRIHVNKSQGNHDLHVISITINTNMYLARCLAKHLSIEQKLQVPKSVATNKISPDVGSSSDHCNQAKSVNKFLLIYLLIFLKFLILYRSQQIKEIYEWNLSGDSLI